MKRRGFLKLLGIGAAIPTVTKASSKTDPKGLIAELPETIDTYSNDSSAIVTIRPATYMACTVSTVCSADVKWEYIKT